MPLPFRDALAAVALLTACGADAPVPPPAVIDSAGIAVVTSAAPDRVDTVPDRPRWRVGGDGGSLAGVGDLTVTTSGDIVVANEGNATIIAFDPDGAVRWRFGRSGEGPGEFQSFLTLAAIGDTVHVLDFTTRRLTAIGPDGALRGVVQVTSAAPNLELAGGLADGTLLVTSRFLFGPEVGINHDSVSYLRLRPDGTMLGALGWGHEGTVEFFMGEFGPNIHDQALGPTGWVTAHGDGLAHADGSTPQVMIRRGDGSLARLVRWSDPPARVTEADRVAFLDATREGLGDGLRRRQFDEWLPRISWPDMLPASGVVVSRPDGGLLVADYCAARSRHCAWRDFDSTGRWRRTRWLPTRAIDAVVAGDLLVTLSTDVDGFEWLEAWSL